MNPLSLAKNPELSRPAQIKSLWRLLLQWYDANDRDLPWRRAYAKAKDPYPVWVSEIMLQQTVIKAVIPIYQNFLIHFPQLSNLAGAQEHDLRVATRGLGYYRRFQWMQRAAKQILAAGKWPSSYEEWLEVPGVGPYTAAAVSSIVLNESKLVVDGNVERIFCRLFDWRLPANHPVVKSTIRAMEERWAPKVRPGDGNQALMELGQLLCRPTKPRCGECPVAGFCEAKTRGSQDLAPAAKVKDPFVSVKLRLVIDWQRGRLELSPRQGARFLSGHPGLPTFLLQSKDTWVEDSAEGALAPPKASFWAGRQVIGVFQHSITRHKLSVEVMVTNRFLRSEVATSRKRVRQFLAQEQEILTSSLDRKAFRLLESSLGSHS
jgi:A/G-specific adenine glycosylase